MVGRDVRVGGEVASNQDVVIGIFKQGVPSIMIARRLCELWTFALRRNVCLESAKLGGPLHVDFLQKDKKQVLYAAV